jgi:hypothetical protein
VALTNVLLNAGLGIYVVRGKPPEVRAPAASGPTGNTGLAERLEPIESQGNVLPSAYEQNEVQNRLTKRASPPIQVCFKALTDRDPAIRNGKVDVDWQILPSGKTKSPEVVTSELPQLNECIVRVLKDAEFPHVLRAAECFAHAQGKPLRLCEVSSVAFGRGERGAPSIAEGKRSVR